ncbi:uncharacterized protein [Montipora capricornis]
MSLVNMQESNQLNLSEWQASVDEAKESFDFNQPLVDPVFDTECFSMLSWAAMLGKVRIVKWLLEQDFIVLFRNAEDTANGPVGSNRTALFSAARHLHIGLTTRQTYEIHNCFARILDEFLKRDPRVLLVEEGEANKITLLHLCAEGDEESTAPFVSYLKRILAKLSDLKKENLYTKERLIEFLEQKNCRGDTFLHLVAKYKTREEAREVIKVGKEKFYDIIDLAAMENNEGKTVDDVLEDSKHEPVGVASDMLQSYGGDGGNHIQDSQSVNSNQTNPVDSMNNSSSTPPHHDEGKTVDDVLEDFKQDPEVFDAGSEETEYCLLIVGASDANDEDEKGFDTTSPTDDQCPVKSPLQENQGCSAMSMPVASTPSGGKTKSLAESPPRLFPAFEPDDMLQSYGGDDGNHIQDSQYSVNSNQANPVESMNSRSSSTPEIEEDETVRKWIFTTTSKLDQKQRRLEEVKQSLERCREQMESLSQEERDIKSDIAALEEKLACLDHLSKLKC